LKREVRLLHANALDSLILSIEHFNRPWDRGRVSSVLILLDHAFEQLLKAAILHRGGKIRKPRERQTIGFDECVRKSLTDGEVRFLTDEQTLLLQEINGLRDAAYHHLIEISEQLLYLQTQAGVTLFRDILRKVFGEELAASLPERVLPLSTTPALEPVTLFEREVEEVKKLLRPGSRRQLQATARLKTLAILDGAVKGERIQPSNAELRKLVKRIRDGLTWEQLFPGIASIQITAEGYGPSLSLRITKKEGIPIQLVKEGTEGSFVVGVKRVNELDFYNLTLAQIAAKVDLSEPRTLEVIRHFKLQEDEECFKLIQIGSSKFRRYSRKALERLSATIPSISIDEVWAVHRPQKNRVRAS